MRRFGYVTGAALNVAGKNGEKDIRNECMEMVLGSTWVEVGGDVGCDWRDSCHQERRRHVGVDVAGHVRDAWFKCGVGITGREIFGHGGSWVVFGDIFVIVGES